MSHPLTSLHSAGLSGASRGAGKPGQGLVAPQVAALLPTVRLAMDSYFKSWKDIPELRRARKYSI